VTFLRSFVFNAAFFGWTAILGLLYLPLLLAPPPAMRAAGAAWARSVLALARALAGIRWEVRGADRVPAGAAILAAKHQSAWDTLFFPAHFGHPALAAKRELRWIPFYGWYAWRAGMVWVDRAGRARALRDLVRGARRVLAEGRPLVVFPQGTRTRPGEAAPYQPGIAALYGATGVPVVPTALNSGLFWGRRAFLKRPGTIIVEFLEPMPAGLDRDAFLDELGRRIEAATRRLEAEGGGGGRPGARARPAAVCCG